MGQFKFNAGFTFLETLVVLAIFSLVFPLALSILLVIMQQQLRIFSLSEVKRQGDYIVNYLQDNISNNAYTIYNGSGNEICEAGSFLPFPHTGDVASFRNQYNSQFWVSYPEPDVGMDYDPPVFPAPTFAFKTGDLNNSRVRIENFQISCERLSSFSAPLIRMSFRACFNYGGSCTAPGGPQKAVSLNYQTDIKLRNFPTE